MLEQRKSQRREGRGRATPTRRGRPGGRVRVGACASVYSRVKGRVAPLNSICRGIRDDCGVHVGSDVGCGCRRSLKQHG